MKQVLVVNKGLGMRQGKVGAQCAHAAMSFITRGLKQMILGLDYRSYEFKATDEQVEWMQTSFKEIVVYVENDEELLEVERRAQEKGLVNHMVVDSGLTEFDGVPTRTVLAIGPHSSEMFEGVTDHLPLL